MPKTNAEMCEIVSLRKKNRIRDARVSELEKMLRRAQREIETLQAQYGDSQSDQLLAKIEHTLSTPMEAVY